MGSEQLNAARRKTARRPQLSAKLPGVDLASNQKLCVSVGEAISVPESNIGQCLGRKAVSVPMFRAESSFSASAQGEKQFQCQCSGRKAVPVPTLRARSSSRANTQGGVKLKPVLRAIAEGSSCV